MNLNERLHYASIGACQLGPDDALAVMPIDDHEAALEREFERGKEIGWQNCAEAADSPARAPLGALKAHLENAMAALESSRLDKVALRRSVAKALEALAELQGVQS